MRKPRPVYKRISDVAYSGKRLLNAREHTPYHPKVERYKSPKNSFLDCLVYLAKSAPQTAILRKKNAEPPTSNCCAGVTRVRNSLNSDTIASTIKKLSNINTLAIMVQTALFFTILR